MQALERRTSQRIVAEKFGVAKTTVANIWKDHDVTRLLLALHDEDHFARDYHIHVPRSTRCSSTNPIMKLASHDFAVRVNAYM